MGNQLPVPGLARPRPAAAAPRATSCAHCKWAEPENGVSKNFECHINPPQATFLATNKGPALFSSFPVVRPEQWCGQWASKVEPASAKGLPVPVTIIGEAANG